MVANALDRLSTWLMENIPTRPRTGPPVIPYGPAPEDYYRRHQPVDWSSLIAYGGAPVKTPFGMLLDALGIKEDDYMNFLSETPTSREARRFQAILDYYDRLRERIPENPTAVAYLRGLPEEIQLALLRGGRSIPPGVSLEPQMTPLHDITALLTSFVAPPYSVKPDEAVTWMALGGAGTRVGKSATDVSGLLKGLREAYRRYLSWGSELNGLRREAERNPLASQRLFNQAYRIISETGDHERGAAIRTWLGKADPRDPVMAENAAQLAHAELLQQVRRQIEAIQSKFGPKADALINRVLDSVDLELTKPPPKPPRRNLWGLVKEQLADERGSFSTKEILKSFHEEATRWTDPTGRRLRRGAIGPQRDLVIAEQKAAREGGRPVVSSLSEEPVVSTTPRRSVEDIERELKALTKMLSGASLQTKLDIYSQMAKLQEELKRLMSQK